MKVTFKKAPKKFLEGGEMMAQNAPQEAMVNEEPQQDPIAMIMQAAVQAILSQDCQMAIQVCQALILMAQQSGEQAPTPEEPVYRRNGGSLVRRGKQ